MSLTSLQGHRQSHLSHLIPLVIPTVEPRVERPARSGVLNEKGSSAFSSFTLIELAFLWCLDLSFDLEVTFGGVREGTGVEVDGVRFEFDF